MRGPSEGAVHVVRVAALDLHLDGGVDNRKLVPQLIDDSRQDLLPFSHALFADEDMAATGYDAGGKVPNVKIVDP